MGAPFEVELRFGNRGSIFVYSHYDGYEDSAVKKVRECLAHAEPRWRDEEYGARMFLSKWFEPLLLDETGYGVSPYLTDSMIPRYVINLTEGTVQRRGMPITFEQFLNDPVGFAI